MASQDDLDRKSPPIERAGFSGARYRSALSSIEAACLALLASLLLWRGIVPGWLTLNSDFPNYYLVARLLHGGFSLDRIYDWVWLQRIKDHWGLDQGLVGFAGLTPFSALPVLPLSGLSAIDAKRIWILANIMFLFGTVEALVRVTELSRRRMWILCLLAIIPLRANFLLGQMHILVLLLVTLAYFFHHRNRGIACGICLSLAGALKVYPLLFAFYFLWKRQWRAVISMIGFTLVLLGIGYVWMGSHVFHIYLTEVLPRSMQGEGLDPYNARLASGSAFFHRLFIFEPDLNPTPAFRSPLLYAALYPLWQLVILLPLFAGIGPASGKKETEQIEWAAFLCTLLVLSPVPSSYHFVTMIFSIVLLADVLVRRRQYSRLAVAVALYFSICVIGYLPVTATLNFSFLTILAFGRLWIGMSLWLFFVIYLWRKRKPLESSGSGYGWMVQLVAVLGIFWIAGFVSYRRHFADLERDIAARLHVPVQTFLAGGMHPKPGGFLFTAMAPQGYRILDEQGKGNWPAISQGSHIDQLASAVATNGSLTLLEFADATGSRVTEAPALAGGSGPVSTTPLQITNAETPAISPDGSMIAFIREEKGRGRLWIAHLESKSGQMNVSSLTQAVTDSYDVQDMTFAPSGSIFFSARMDGKESIFQLGPGNSPDLFLSEDEDAGSPAISPDGQRMAFRRLRRNRWQLAIIDLRSRRERYLTSGDCNAYDPAWMDQMTIGYATDCRRGMGLTALAAIHIDP